jgi:hypothetical protein
MPSINDRIGSQNVIRVLSNASAAPTRIINLTDVESTLKTRDGMLLVWNLEDEKFYMTDTIDSSSLIATGIVTFSNTTQSSSTTTGAVIVSGGVGIAKNLNVGGDAKIVGVVTFGTGSVVIDGTNDIINVGSGVTVSSSDGITAPSINILGPLTAQSLSISGVSTLASAGGITTTGGSLFVNNNLTIGQNLKVDGTSEFIGVATFRGGTINLGDANSDDINVGGEFISDLNPNDDATYDLGIDGKRWRTGRFSGLVTTTDLFVSGLSTFTGNQFTTGNVSITGFVTVTEGLYYDVGDFDGPNGVSYFDDSGKLIGAASTESGISTSNYVLTTNASGTPVWTSTIDGGEY